MNSRNETYSIFYIEGKSDFLAIDTPLWQNNTSEIFSSDNMMVQSIRLIPKAIKYTVLFLLKQTIKTAVIVIGSGTYRLFGVIDCHSSKLLSVLNGLDYRQDMDLILPKKQD